MASERLGGHRFLVISRAIDQNYYDLILAASASSAASFIRTCRDYAEIVDVLDEQEMREQVAWKFDRHDQHILADMKDLAAGAPKRLEVGR